jgi:hypothetical protein
MFKWFGVILLVFSLGSCSKVLTSALGLGGGPKIAANVQAGKTNSQTIGSSNTSAPSVSIRPKARVDTVDQSVNTYQELPIWVWILALTLFILGWVTDTPATYIRSIFKGKRND